MSKMGGELTNVDGVDEVGGQKKSDGKAQKTLVRVPVHVPVHVPVPILAPAAADPNNATKRVGKSKANRLDGRGDGDDRQGQEAGSGTGENEAGVVDNGSGNSSHYDYPDILDDNASESDNTAASLTVSVSSSVYQYPVENGRRYHAFQTGRYALPNDEQELDRLDYQNHLFNLTLGGKLSIAPIAADVQDVLDVGTGTGIWAIEFADEHPSARVIGTDLSPVQPAFVPPNCSFLIDDIEAEWIFHQSFDYIHGRMIAVSVRDWPHFFAQAYENLKPGGWLEIQDLCFPLRCDDGSTPAESPELTWSASMVAGAGKLGIDLGAAANFADWATKAGFVDVRESRYAWPIGPWGQEKHHRELGKWSLQNFMEGLQGFTMGFFTRGLGWSKDEVEVFLVDVRRAMLDVSNHVYLPIRVCCARKPEAN